MNFNPFTTVSDYPSMLDKIAWYTLAVTLACIAVLRALLPGLDSFLKPLNISVSLVNGVASSLGTVLPALVLAFISRVTKFHDRISDLFGIRQRFDVNHILLPSALVSGATCSVASIPRMKRERDTLMYQVFYKYASSSPGKAQIELHYITMALDAWSWYWVVTEAIAWLLLTSLLVALFSNHYLVSLILLLIVLALFGLQQIIAGQCSDYAMQEVDQILSDNARRLEVQKVFNAL